MTMPAPLDLAPAIGTCVCFVSSERDGLAWVALVDGEPLCWDGWYAADGIAARPLNDVLPPEHDPADLADVQRSQLPAVVASTCFPLFDGTAMLPLLQVRSSHPSWGAGSVPLHQIEGCQLVGLLVLQ